MRKLASFIVGITLPFLSVTAQQADARVGQLISNSDWFALEEEYSGMKDSIQTPFLKLLAEIMINNHFNRPDEALQKIGELLSNHQQEIGFGNVCSMISLASIINGQQGNYAQAADNIKGFLDQIKTSGIEINLQSFEDLYNRYNKLRNYPAPTILRPDTDVEVSISIEPVKFLRPLDGETTRGLKINIPVTVHNKQYHFIFDTGAASTFVSERFAKEAGLKIIEDSLLINQGMIGEGYGMGGFLDSLQIGNIVFRNAMVSISKPNEAVDSIIQIDAVLGMDFMKLLKEIQIDTKEHKIIFPFRTTPIPPTGRNLILTNGNKPIFKAYSNNEQLQFFFDTGNNKADLHYTYYDKNRKSIDPIAQKTTVTGGGFGFVRTKEVLCVPGVSFKVGDTPVELKNVRVDPIANNDQSPEDGNLGMDLVKLFDKTIINLQDMFVKFE